MLRKQPQSRLEVNFKCIDGGAAIACRASRYIHEIAKAVDGEASGVATYHQTILKSCPPHSVEMT